MNPKQRIFYFRLWNQACIEQGWDKLSSAQKNERRRAITKQACGVESSQHLTNIQITSLFNTLKHLARPFDLAAARAVANPQEAAADDQCRRLIFKINECGFARPYLNQMAKGLRTQHHVSEWDRLPAAALHRLLVIAERKRSYSTLSHPVIEYQLKPTPALSRRRSPILL